MTRVEREMTSHLADYGVTIIGQRYGKHLVVKCLNKNGRRFNIAVPREDGDPRTVRNFLGEIARRSVLI
jgi:hypothetical protein